MPKNTTISFSSEDAGTEIEVDGEGEGKQEAEVDGKGEEKLEVEGGGDFEAELLFCFVLFRFF